MIHGLSPDNYSPFLINMFLHAGWLHLIGNMWFLHLFGSTVEDRLGHLRFLFFYLLSGFAANLIFFMVDPHSTIPEFGASGAIAGVMGGYILMFPRARILTLIPILFIPFFVKLPAFLYLSIWFLIQVLSGTLSFSSHGAGGGSHGGHILVDLPRGWCFSLSSETESFPIAVPFLDKSYHFFPR